MKIKIYSLIFASALIMTGCSKDFLETEPTEFISADQIEEATAVMPELQNANIRGLYSTMIAPGSGGSSGTTHDDFGRKGHDIYTDLLCGDMVLGGYTYGWYQAMAEYRVTVNYTSLRNYMPWRFYYRLIFGANLIIDGFGGNDVVLEDETARNIYGQAKAIRAYSYFYLANFYGEGTYNAGDLILPIYDSAELDAQPLSTAGEVYALIVDDLTQAVELLSDFQRSSENEINASVAKGLLAYAYAAMGDYGMVKTLTNEIITTGGYSLMTPNQLVGGLDPDGDGVVDYSAGGFNDIYSTDWMWGQDLTAANDLYLASWWGQVDIYTFSYASVGDVKSINTELYNAIAADDIRKQQFVDLFGNGQYIPINKFYAPARTPGGQQPVLTDYIYMRVEEMYLLNAEAAAKTGDEPTAKQSLIDLMEIRVPDASYINSLTGQALLDEIYLQTRIELWGEGKSYFAMKRLEKTITLGSNHLTFPGEVISYDDDRMTFDIPDEEVLNNPNI